MIREPQTEPGRPKLSLPTWPGQNNSPPPGPGGGFHQSDSPGESCHFPGEVGPHSNQPHSWCEESDNWRDLQWWRSGQRTSGMVSVLRERDGWEVGSETARQGGSDPEDCPGIQNISAGLRSPVAQSSPDCWWEAALPVLTVPSNTRQVWLYSLHYS